MSYGQQPNQSVPAGVPPVPPAPTAQQGYGSSPAPGAQGSYGAPSGYDAQQGYAGRSGYAAPAAYGQYGAPGAPWSGPIVPMKRPGTVTTGSVLAFIGGGFMVLLGLIFAIAGGSSDIQDAVAETYGSGFGAVVVGVGLVLALIGGLVILFGVMAFKGKRWGAIGLAVMAGLTVVGGISDLASGSGSGLLGVAWSVTGAVLLLVSSSQAWYRSQA